MSLYRAGLLIVASVVVFGCSATPSSTKGDAKGPKPEASRKTVKTASDPDAALINATPKDTTVEAILAQKDPTGGKLKGRASEFEKQTWRVKATVKSVQLKKDGDYYLVLAGEKGSRTVVEVPDPKLCPDSRFLSDISSARKTIEAKYHPTSDVKDVNDKATITGVGFLGWGAASKKGAKGHSGPRLMPGTGITFGG